MILCRIVKNLQYQSYRISFGPPQNVAKSGREEKLGIPRRRKADADPLQRMGIEQKCFEARRVKRARSSEAFLNFWTFWLLQQLRVSSVWTIWATEGSCILCTPNHYLLHIVMWHLISEEEHEWSLINSHKMKEKTLLHHFNSFFGVNSTHKYSKPGWDKNSDIWMYWEFLRFLIQMLRVRQKWTNCSQIDIQRKLTFPFCFHFLLYLKSKR